MKYEYKILTAAWQSDVVKFEALLNEHGAQGWQAIEFRWGSGDFVHVALMRDTPKEETVTVRGEPRSLSEFDASTGEIDP